MQATLAICNEMFLLSSVDLRDLERLTVDPAVEYRDTAAVSDISELRRNAIVLLLAEISALREDYGFPG
jgi:hypothetical protein